MEDFSIASQLISHVASCHMVLAILLFPREMVYSTTTKELSYQYLNYILILITILRHFHTRKLWKTPHSSHTLAEIYCAAKADLWTSREIKQHCPVGWPVAMKAPTAARNRQKLSLLAELPTHAVG